MKIIIYQIEYIYEHCFQVVDGLIYGLNIISEHLRMLEISLYPLYILYKNEPLYHTLNIINIRVNIWYEFI